MHNVDMKSIVACRFIPLASLLGFRCRFHANSENGLRQRSNPRNAKHLRRQFKWPMRFPGVSSGEPVLFQRSFQEQLDNLRRCHQIDR